MQGCWLPVKDKPPNLQKSTYLLDCRGLNTIKRIQPKGFLDLEEVKVFFLLDFRHDDVRTGWMTPGLKDTLIISLSRNAFIIPLPRALICTGLSTCLVYYIPFIQSCPSVMPLSSCRTLCSRSSSHKHHQINLDLK
jgi:hypothetical protein